jgi:hypothetical protein
MQACHAVANFVEDYPTESLPQQLIDAHTTAMVDVATAMRVDLGVDTLDKWSNHWFKRTENEGLHEQWRKFTPEIMRERRQRLS